MNGLDNGLGRDHQSFLFMDSVLHFCFFPPPIREHTCLQELRGRSCLAVQWLLGELTTESSGWFSGTYA